MSIGYNATKTVGRAFLQIESRGDSIADANAGPRIHSERSHGNVFAVWRDRVGGGGDRSLTRPFGEVSEQIRDDFDEDVNYVVKGLDDFDEDVNYVVEGRQGRRALQATLSSWRRTPLRAGELSGGRSAQVGR